MIKKMTPQLFLKSVVSFTLVTFLLVSFVFPFTENASAQQHPEENTQNSELKTYSYHKQPSFSFDYPKDWVMDENLILSNGWAASFYDDIQEKKITLDLYVYENNVQIKNLLDNPIKEYMFLSYFLTCDGASVNVTGYDCFLFTPLDFKITELDEEKSYQVAYSSFKTYPDGSVSENVKIVTDIWAGDSKDYIVSIQSEMAAEDYEKYVDTYDGILESVKFLQESELNQIVIPQWIKKNAKWWAEGLIGERDLVSGIEYMMKENIVFIPYLPEQASETAEAVPDWIKNNAGWWADGLISDDDFVSGIKYLVEQGIMSLIYI